MRREYILHNILKDLRPDYDFILIDRGPSLGVLTVNALMAADSVLIDSTPESDSNEGTKLLVKSIQLVHKKYKHTLTILYTYMVGEILYNCKSYSMLKENAYGGDCKCLQIKFMINPK